MLLGFSFHWARLCGARHVSPVVWSTLHWTSHMLQGALIKAGWCFGDLWDESFFSFVWSDPEMSLTQSLLGTLRLPPCPPRVSEELLPADSRRSIDGRGAVTTSQQNGVGASLCLLSLPTFSGISGCPLGLNDGQTWPAGRHSGWRNAKLSEMDSRHPLHISPSPASFTGPTKVVSSTLCTYTKSSSSAGD